MKMTGTTFADALSQYEAEHAFAREVTLPVEDRKHLQLPFKAADCGYRWFRSSNVLCLEKYRRLRASTRSTRF